MKGKSEYIYYSPELDEIRYVFTNGAKIIRRKGCDYYRINNEPEVTTVIQDNYGHQEYTFKPYSYEYFTAPELSEIEIPIIDNGIKSYIDKLWSKFRTFLKGEEYDD